MVAVETDIGLEEGIFFSSSSSPAPHAIKLLD